MEKISFWLKQPVRITPLSGESVVNVETTGEVDVRECQPTVHKVRQVYVCGTKHATLTRSPMDVMRTVKIILPTSRATEREFQKELTKLFDMLMIQNQ